jgi:hypothetical protein
LVAFFIIQTAQRNWLVAELSPHVDHVHLDWKGTFLKLPETDVNLIFLDCGCLDKDMNSNEAVAVSRITQNDQISLLEPRQGNEVRDGFARGSSLACGYGGKPCGSPHCG